jgi:hypothetical protein
VMSMKFRAFWDVASWWWSHYAPLKRQSTWAWLHGAASQKTKFRHELQLNVTGKLPLKIQIWSTVFCIRLRLLGSAWLETGSIWSSVWLLCGFNDILAILICVSGGYLDVKGGSNRKAEKVTEWGLHNLLFILKHYRCLL